MHARSNPDSIANLYGLCEASACSAFHRVNGVIRRIDTDSRRKEHMVTDVYATAIKHDAIEVGIEIVANVDIPPELTTEGGFEVYVST